MCFLKALSNLLQTFAALFGLIQSKGAFPPVQSNSLRWEREDGAAKFQGAKWRRASNLPRLQAHILKDGHRPAQTSPRSMAFIQRQCGEKGQAWLGSQRSLELRRPRHSQQGGFAFKLAPTRQWARRRWGTGGAGAGRQ